MKKVLKIAGIVIGVILLILIAGFLILQLSPKPTYEAQDVSFEVDHSPQNVQNGQRMASMMCAMCHRGKDGTLSGQLHSEPDNPLGKIWSANITKHPEYGIGAWSDGELAYFIRTGIARDGHFTIQPWMPKWPHLSDRDLADVIAFLRSDHPLVQPSEVQHPDPEPSFLNKFLSRVAFKPLPYPEARVASPDTSDPIAFGKYLVNDKLLCYSCHSASFETTDEMNPIASEGYLGGGTPMMNHEGEIIVTSNLTMHPTGLKGWSREDFTTALKWGTRPDGALIREPMPKFSALTEREIGAIWSYIQQVEPIENEVSTEAPDVK